ncbi:YqaJ viral recombinase family protein [Marinobacter alexandrii]|uniref:YqaJ viral recombinase family protein n=1 Tax=Marinobacter alexandrii TaxID=2570351 RepID=UPI001109CBA6|nr:YqaJ viral recombinase family protein [Marinobacter alexandrii]
MIILDMAQGSDQWLAARRMHDTASEASVMMACSKNASRNELLHMKTTGTDREFGDWFQKNILDKGHEVEAQARPIAEEIVGEDLFPVTATDDDGWLLASFDGITMLEDVIWECKQWNEEKAGDVRDGRVPECDKWQVAQQLRVSGAEKCLYMVTDGTKEGTVYLWVLPKKEDDRLLVAGWKQFDEDRKNYEHVEYAPKPEGKAPDALPALRIELTGMVKASNLQEFRDTALAAINKVSTDLQTDEDFASAEKGVKWCKDVETRLSAAKDHALSQTQTIDELFKTIDSISAEARQKRLDLEKLVKSRKEAIRSEILQKSKGALDNCIGDLAASVKQCMPPIHADFSGVMKGKKTIKSLQSACDDELARAKIEVHETANRIQGNLRQIDEHAADYRFLFNDLSQIANKPADDFAAIVKMRIAEHKEAEEKRLEAEREKIRQEEAFRADQEALKAKQEEQEQRQADQAETAKIEQSSREHHGEDKKPAQQKAPQLNPTETVTLSVKEYEQLVQNSKMYLALAAAGVDNWEGYDIAMEIMREAA